MVDRFWDEVVSDPRHTSHPWRRINPGLEGTFLTAAVQLRIADRPGNHCLRLPRDPQMARVIADAALRLDATLGRLRRLVLEIAQSSTQSLRLGVSVAGRKEHWIGSHGLRWCVEING